MENSWKKFETFQLYHHQKALHLFTCVSFVPFEQCLVCASESDDVEIAADRQTLQEQQKRLFCVVDLFTTHASRPGKR